MGACVAQVDQHNLQAQELLRGEKQLVLPCESATTEGCGHPQRHVLDGEVLVRDAPIVQEDQSLQQLPQNVAHAHLGQIEVEGERLTNALLAVHVAR